MEQCPEQSDKQGVRLGVWLRDWWNALRIWHESRNAQAARVVIAQMVEANRRLLEQNAVLRSEKRAMRDSIVGHMCHERDMLQEISSLRRHLNMAIEERDQAREHKRPKGPAQKQRKVG